MQIVLLHSILNIIIASLSIRRRKSKHDYHQNRIIQGKSNEEEEFIFRQNRIIHGKTGEKVEDEDKHGRFYYGYYEEE